MKLVFLIEEHMTKKEVAEQFKKDVAELILRRGNASSDRKVKIEYKTLLDILHGIDIVE